MGIKTTAKKSYLVNRGNETPGTALLPEVSLQVEYPFENTNKFNIVIVASNAASLSLSRQLFLLQDDGSKVAQGAEELFVVTDLSFKLFDKDRSFITRFILTATNSIGTVSTQPLDIGQADPSVIDLEDGIVLDFNLSREPKTYNLINAQLILLITNVFDISKLSGLQLIYKRRDLVDWNSIELSTDKYIVSQDRNGKETAYIFDFKKQSIVRPSLGGNFDFYIKISFSNSEAQDTNKITLFFENVDATAPQRPIDSSISTNIIDPNNPATLRYEITTKFSEIYKIFNSSSTVDPRDQDSKPVVDEDYSEHNFLDNSKFKGLNIGSYAFVAKGSQYLFNYEYNGEEQAQDTKGYFYPASVSEIYPCIITNKEGLYNKSIILYWKVNDNFFNYKFFEKNISIVTTLFQVKLQYYYSGSYVDLTGPITITEDPETISVSENKKFGFFTKYQKFILSIERGVDISNSVQHIFDSITEFDNSNNNLRLVVVKHNVTCSAKTYPTKTYSFDKMLIPPEWKYIVYDKYIPNDIKIRTENDKRINLDLNDPLLRGIKLPEAGFYKYDKLNKINREFSDSRSNYSITTFDLNILYKLSCEYDVFYRDPILEGTINSVLLPSVPKDVFLIPPSLIMPAPNLIPESDGGKQAEGIVKVNEYGKITGIQITDPGHGYSLFKTVQDKRQQSFTDLIPYVKKSYQIVANDLNINREVLVLQNSSFDKENLKASLQGGIRLASAYSDKQKLEQNGGDPLSIEQKNKADEYLNDYLPQETTSVENSIKPYDVESTPEQKDVSSIGVLNETWNIISKLYTDKYINPLEQSQVYTEDTDAGVSEIEESTIQSSINYTKDSSSITPTSLNPEIEQKNADGGAPELFSLNNLTVVPDASAAVFIANKFTPPPSLTLLPLSVRADGQYGFGPLPNMAPRAEMFNRLVMGINNLNEVRVILPMIWALDSESSFDIYNEEEPGGGQYDLISYSTNGLKTSLPSQSSQYLPLNSMLSVSNYKEVERIVANADDNFIYGITKGVTYRQSKSYSSTQKFQPFVHPLMARSFNQSFLRTFKRKILGIVTEQTTSCVNNNATIGINGSPEAPARGGGSVPVPAGTLIPTTNTNVNVYFEFFNSGGTLSANNASNAQSLSLLEGINTYNNISCGDRYDKSVDFTYANIFPGTIKI